jgi:hypothetical protein
MKGVWKLTALKRAKRAHMMTDDTHTFCGRTLLHSRPADELGEWHPEDHLDICCPSCLEWYRAMKPKNISKKAEV